MNVGHRTAAPGGPPAPAAHFGGVVDVGLATVLAVVLVGTAWAIADTWGGDYWQFGFAVGVVMSVLALLRRRHRVGIAIAGLVVAAAATVTADLAGLPGEPGPATVLALFVLVGSAVRVLPAIPAGAVASGGLAVVAGSWLAELPSSGVPTLTVWSGAGWSAAVAVGLLGRLLVARRRAVAETVRRDERLDMARELHDVVAHHITGIVLQTQAARLVARKQPEQLDGSLAEIEDAGSDALAAMRRVVGLLREADDGLAVPGSASPGPATPGLEQLSELVERFDGHGRAVRLRLPDGDPGWPPELRSTVYRVVQESLTNVSRHAPDARSVTVDIAQDRSAVTVEVGDDAPPARTRHRRAGYGLVGMRERVEALGGTLRAGLRADGGWSVEATLPLTARESR